MPTIRTTVHNGTKAVVIVRDLTSDERVVLARSAVAVRSASPDRELLASRLKRAADVGRFPDVTTAQATVAEARRMLARIAAESNPDKWIVDVTGMSDGMELVSIMVAERSEQYRRLHDAVTVISEALNERRFAVSL